MLGFNLFMHIFLIVTRHSKEQYIKEQRKVVHFRRRAYKVKDWNKYAFIVQHELDMERLKYLDIVNFVLQHLDIQRGAYKSSFVKYSMKRSKDRQMKDARTLILRDIEQTMLDSTEFNKEMLSRG